MKYSQIIPYLPDVHMVVVTGRPLPPPQPGTHWLHPHVRGRPPVWLVPPHWDHEDSHLAWCWSEGGEA